MMECNKEEAIRAKEIAETKMQNKDFLGARKVALKAQQLYPDLENISQLLMVCDVHISAESKSHGSEKNFYDILKIESTADEISIKKQYRKYALLLHPDKNKFAGATDAFKLIGEAQRVLLDRGTRSLHDAKLKKCRPNRAPPQQQANSNNNNPNVRTQNWAQNPFMGKPTFPFSSFNPQPQHQQQQQQPPKPSGPSQPTFWTMCPHCVVKYQYYSNMIGKTLSCQRCKKTFTGHEIKDQPTVNPTPFAYKPTIGVNVGSQRNPSFELKAKQPVAKTGIPEVRRDTKSQPKVTTKVNGKRKIQIDESESSDSDTSSESEEDDIIDEYGDVRVKKDFGCFGENLRRSTRSKTNISYKENLSDDEDVPSSSKKPKSSGSFSLDKDPVLEKEVPETKKYEGSSDPTEEIESEKEKDGLSDMENGENTNVEANGGTLPDPEIFNYPDPDFNDFDEGRVDSLEVGQIWAVYDTMDGMPRFYARISRILSKTAFKLKITWLETEPDNENELKWVNAGLPASCGNFKRGDTETTQDRRMFSHQVVWEKGRNRDRFKMYPRKGETWALFKNWDMNWHSNSESERKFEFEFVEILSDYCEDTGVSVAYLSKIKGFSCLFYRTGVDSLKIPRSQLFRFSHRVPCIRLSGEERVDVPKGSLELDPASLPNKIEEIDIPKDPKTEPETVIISEEDSSEYEVKDVIESDSEENSNSGEEEDDPEAYEIPEPEFFNFDNEKSPEKFQPGQFWALYSDEDGLPKYYAFIRKVDKAPKFKLHVSWLAACPTKSTLNYTDKRMPISCGSFEHYKGDTLSYTNTGIFSHQLIVEPTNKMDEFAIYPKTGEVWAVYKNWKSKMTPSDLKKCKYDIVEIIEDNDLFFKGVVLEMLSGHNSVFKAQKHNGSLVTVQIDRTFLHKFSHKIPAFRLTGEKGGSLRGFFELDPAALPIGMFSSS